MYYFGKIHSNLVREVIPSLQIRKLISRVTVWKGTWDYEMKIVSQSQLHNKEVEELECRHQSSSFSFYILVLSVYFIENL